MTLSAVTPISNESAGLALYEGQDLRIVIPAHPLANGSVKIESKYGGRHFTDWTRQENVESYALLQKVISLWEKKGIHDYLVIGLENDQPDFGWEIVPFTNREYNFLKQLQVAWRTFFGGMNLDETEKKQLVEEYKSASDFISAPLPTAVESDLLGQDAFCKEAVIEAQKVIDDPEKDVRVLYDYRPLTEYHFLTVTKKHDEKFSSVPAKAYVEATGYAQELLKKYGKEGTTSYLYHKTGRLAGQSVPHWHMHVVMPQTQEDEMIGRIKIFLNIVWGTSPLKRQELNQRVSLFRSELKQDPNTGSKRKYN